MDTILKRTPELNIDSKMYESTIIIKTKSHLSGLSVLAALITLPSHDVSTMDLLEVKATSSGINKFVSKVSNCCHFPSTVL